MSADLTYLVSMLAMLVGSAVYGGWCARRVGDPDLVANEQAKLGVGFALRLSCVALFGLGLLGWHSLWG